LATLPGKQRLGVKSLRTDKAVAAAQYSEQPIKMVIVGDFDGFYSFLLDLERLKRITRMNQMQLKRIQNDEGQMQAEITLSIFFDPSGDNSKNAAPKPEADRKKGAL
jgi:Tfp pilus assembly protein PilO